MSIRDNAEALIERIETSTALDEEQKVEIALWMKGRALAHVVNSEGWDVVVEMLNDYARDAQEELVELRPGSELIQAAHANAYAATEIARKFVQDVARAIAAAQTQPETLRHAKREVPIDSL